MANRQRAEARRKAAAKAARGQEGAAEGGASKGLMWTIIALLVVVAVGGILWATLGGKNDSAATDSTTLTSDPTGTTGGLPDSQPITVTGDPLPAFESGGGTDPAVGLAAPVIDGLNFNGEKISLNSADGAYMVVFLAHWCPHCNAEVPRLLQWKHSGAVPADLRVIGVATAVSPVSPNYPPAQWFSNKGWEWPVMVDEKQGDARPGKAAEAFGASGWPYFIIVGKDGKVKVRVSGEISVADLTDVVNKAMAA
ncbi:MAG: hypothetical protein RLZ14_2106 [Actinomycetota bacterium]